MKTSSLLSFFFILFFFFLFFGGADSSGGFGYGSGGRKNYGSEDQSYFSKYGSSSKVVDTSVRVVEKESFLTELQKPFKFISQAVYNAMSDVVGGAEDSFWVVNDYLLKPVMSGVKFLLKTIFQEFIYGVYTLISNTLSPLFSALSSFFSLLHSNILSPLSSFLSSSLSRTLR
eukprot:TRINITY_DN11815_c0_g1_i1.p1 TRINITY_DN11815_c0_g1~~TRINITY_DN11815_c0_g1_i1.p1  ORF type:complete len:173 (-),score=62.27 TRINITY_DN11815_c0_g1_i1:4-522(-)